MSWNSYELDQIAQKLVLKARARDPKSLNQGHKMRMSIAYGLERFWGEHLRLGGKDKTQAKADYWKETWDELVKVMARADVKLPNEKVNIADVKQVQAMSEKLWKLTTEEQRISIAVLTQLCDCIVWWTQRCKVGSLDNDSDS